MLSQENKNKSFYWLTMDESIKPSHFVGSFDPAITLKKGFTLDAFNPGPLLSAMLEGGTFLANEINRATEYSQNTLLEPLEEASIGIPHLGRIKADENFFFISAMNPEELTESDIIRINLPEHFTVEESELELIYSIINETRRNKIDIEVPASIRAGIAIAKLIARRRLLEKQGELKEPRSIYEHLSEITKHVLLGSIKPKPGVKVESIIDNIIHKTIGV